MINRLAVTLASVFYIGFIPGAPGTYGSLAAAAALCFIGQYGNWIHPLTLLACVGIITLLGVPASAAASKNAGDEDPSFVVIDEVAGQLLTFFLIPFSFANIILGFAAFRAFDIFKPWPIRKLEPLPHGIGIMADDLLAGVYACAALHIINAFLSLTGLIK
ncbi:MAG: phosphatidylglycerophosphatase A [Acidobacteria bacterium]|nr:phosphatidylglycerophosphatase A [Acidobacteriota bacterium]